MHVSSQLLVPGEGWDGTGAEEMGPSTAAQVELQLQGSSSLKLEVFGISGAFVLPDSSIQKDTLVYRKCYFISRKSIFFLKFIDFNSDFKFRDIV